MSEPEQVDLAELFPEMKPIKRPPSLMTMNGIGTSIYGKRNVHEETGTHVKTLCLCLIFVPLWPITAYRVAPAASGGWYFLGKEPLSGFARGWRFLVVAGILTLTIGGVWEHHTTSPEYRAGQELAAADDLLADGQTEAAVNSYISVHGRHHPSRPRIEESLLAALATEAPRASPDEQAAIYLALAGFWNRGGKSLGYDLPGAILAWSQAAGDRGDAVAALDLLGGTRGVLAAEVYTPQRRGLLELAAAQQPPHVASLEELATVLEAEEATPAALQALLEPHQELLGSGEGARILGQIYAAAGEHERAYPLLRPYVKDKLAALEASGQRYEQSIERAWTRAMGKLEAGTAAFDYRRHERSNDDEQQAMVDEFGQEFVSKDPQVKQARLQLVELATVVPVALDLGVVMLHRARTLENPAAQQTELEAAEDTFLAVGGFAGESANYKLFLGQVKYWLGKHDEGRELLEAIIAGADSDIGTHIAVCNTLREVGEFDRAREIAEETYDKATTDEEKFGAARMRALLFTDLDDNIGWLSKCDPAAPDVQSNLASCKGDRAFKTASMEQAAGLYRRAAQGYERLPETSSSSNNAALAHFNLFRALGEPADHARGIELMQRSIALDPSDSIGLLNFSSSLPASAVIELTSGVVDYSLVNAVPGTEVFSYLATSDRELDEWRQRFRSHAAVEQCLEAVDRLTLLAPKSAHSYVTQLAVFRFLRDRDGLEALAAKIEAGHVDVGQIIEQSLERFAGVHDPEDRRSAERHRAHKLVALATARERDDKALESMLLVELVDSRLGWSIYGGALDGEALLRDARAAVAAHPSREAHGTLASVQLQLAVLALAAESGPFRAVHERTRFTIGASTLLALALEHDEELRPLILASARFEEAVAALLELHERFPASRDSRAWALLRHCSPEEAAGITERVKADSMMVERARATLGVSPLDPSTAYSLLWYGEITGQDVGAEAILADMAERGVPLPYLD